MEPMGTNPQPEPFKVMDMAHNVRIRTRRSGIRGYPLSREMTRMVRKIAALFALVLTFSLAAMPVAAQDIDTADLQEFGLENAYLRMYMADPSAATADTSLLGVMVAGFQFESEDTAADAFEEFTCGFASGFMGVEDATDCEALADAGYTVNTDVAINDAPAIEIIGESDINGPTPTNLLAIQDEGQIFVVITLGDDSEGAGDDLGGFLVDAEPTDTEVVFSEDGTSTGGFFDQLPQDGDPVLEGLMPMMDMDFMGSSSSTPAS